LRRWVAASAVVVAMVAVSAVGRKGRARDVREEK
jgi:hypothetical protein